MSENSRNFFIPRNNRHPSPVTWLGDVVPPTIKTSLRSCNNLTPLCQDIIKRALIISGTLKKNPGVTPPRTLFRRIVIFFYKFTKLIPSLFPIMFLSILPITINQFTKMTGCFFYYLIILHPEKLRSKYA